MTETRSESRSDRRRAVAMAVLNAIQNPVIMVDEAGLIAFANWEAEAFFGASAIASRTPQDLHLHSRSAARC